MTNKELIGEATKRINSDPVSGLDGLTFALAHALSIADRKLEIARVEMGDIAMCCPGDCCKGIVDSAFARMAGVK